MATSKFLEFLIEECGNRCIPVPNECSPEKWVVTYFSISRDIEIIVTPQSTIPHAERKLAADLIAIDKALKSRNSKAYRAAIFSAQLRYEAHIDPI